MAIPRDDGLEDTPFKLTAIDHAVLASTDEEFHLHTWEDLKAIIAKNDLHLLKRKPSDLRRYLAWSRGVKATYGSIPNYILRERLKWTPLSEIDTGSKSTGPGPGPGSDKNTTAPPNAFTFDLHTGTPFLDERDYKILPNDWPYGMEAGIVHLIVWLKQRLETETGPAGRGDMTPRSRKQIDDFVRWRFVGDVEALQSPGVNTDGRDGDGGREEAREKVQWFKNWRALQSVPGLEHVHVLVRDVSEEVILGWTGGEVAVQ